MTFILIRSYFFFLGGGMCGISLWKLGEKPQRIRGEMPQRIRGELTHLNNSKSIWRIYKCTFQNTKNCLFYWSVFQIHWIIVPENDDKIIKVAKHFLTHWTAGLVSHWQTARANASRIAREVRIKNNLNEETETVEWDWWKYIFSQSSKNEHCWKFFKTL